MYNTKTLPKVKAKYDFIYIYVLHLIIETVSIIYQGTSLKLVCLMKKVADCMVVNCAVINDC